MSKRLTKKQREMHSKKQRGNHLPPLHVMPKYAISFEQARKASCEEVEQAQAQVRLGEDPNPAMWIPINPIFTIDDMRYATRKEVLGAKPLEYEPKKVRSD